MPRVALILRPAAPADVPQVHALVVAAFQHYVPRTRVAPAPMTADYDAAVAAGQVWLAVQGGRTVGVAVLVPQADHLLLDTVAVAPDGQGQGVGTRLLELADAQARRLGYREVRLYTNAAMTENLAWYPRHGYVETHRATEHGRFHRVFFRKLLPRPDRGMVGG